jgi:hypothetical protein
MEEKMAYYLSIHYEPSVPREKVEGRWIELARERRALWVRTWFNLHVGKRFCWWDAPDKDALEEIFRDHDIPWDEIVQVEHTTPADWVSRED